MRRFANIFLILFLALGAVSLTAEVVFRAAGADPLSAIRRFIFLIVLAAAIPLYACLGIDKRLPKLILLPQLLFVFCSAFQLWPLPVMLHRSDYALAAAVVQVVLGAAPLVYLRFKNGKRFLLAPQKYSIPFFGARNTICFALVNIALIPAALIFMALSSVSLYLYEETAGFARLRPDGMHMSERIYTRGDKEIRLTGMIHIGEKAFFDNSVNSISSHRTVILAEGISDQDNLMQHRFSYVNVAQLLGLTSQEEMSFKGTLVDPGDMSMAALHSEDRTPHIVRADIDVNRFDPRTIEFLNMLGRTLLNSASLPEGIQAYGAWVKNNTDPDTPQTIMNDILHKRNEAVLAHMQTALDHYDIIIIPWGALHMPEIEAAVLNRGFNLTETRSRLSFELKTMPFARILKKLVGNLEAAGTE